MADDRPAFLFDLDGTLVDSVYQHVLAWQEALAASGIELDIWRVHRRIGMSGGLLTNELLREVGRATVSADEVARLQRVHGEAFARLSPRIRPLNGARELLAHLTSVGAPWAIATSGRGESARRTVASLGVPDAPLLPAMTCATPNRTLTCSWPRPNAWAYRLPRASWSATAYGTSWRHAARGRSVLGYCLEAMAAMSWSAPARIASTRTRPTFCHIWTRSGSAR
jgi:hypothetical protein